MDSNIIEPETHYLVSYYIEGNSDNIVGLYAEDTIRIYIGSAPETGSCEATYDEAVTLVFADETTVTLSVSDWHDEDGIFEFNFYFSYDGGDIFVPLEKANRLDTSLNFVLSPIYTSKNVVFKCEAEDVYGFTS